LYDNAFCQGEEDTSTPMSAVLYNHTINSDSMATDNSQVVPLVSISVKISTTNYSSVMMDGFYSQIAGV
jgi:hypothetical protein